MFNANLLKGLITALGVTGFAVIAYFVSQGAAFAFDSAVQSTVFSLRADWLTDLIVPFTFSGNWQAVTTVCVALLIIPQTRMHYGAPLTLSALLSVGFYETLKFIFQRPRPDMALRLIYESGFSFPSGHTLTSLVVWGMLILLIRSYSRVPTALWEEAAPDVPRAVNRRTVRVLTAILTAYIILMGFSRIYVGVHFPTDVIASWCLGSCILIVLHSSLLPALLPKKPRW